MAEISEMRKRYIETEAAQNAKAGIVPRDGCPWPFATNEGRYWVQCWLLAGGQYTDNREADKCEK